MDDNHWGYDNARGSSPLIRESVRDQTTSDSDELYADKKNARTRFLAQ